MENEDRFIPINVTFYGKKLYIRYKEYIDDRSIKDKITDRLTQLILCWNNYHGFNKESDKQGEFK